MPDERYSMSFTTGALLPRESLRVVELYARMGDWQAVRKAVAAGNLLQMRTTNASVRLTREVISRLKLLTEAQRGLLLAGSPEDQRGVLWLALCKRYRFIYDFAVEVLHEKFLRLDLHLDPAEYERFFERKAQWHAEVEAVTPATRKSQRRKLFQAMSEAGILDAARNIVPALLSRDLAVAIAADSPDYFALYPVSQREIAQWTS